MLYVHIDPDRLTRLGWALCFVSIALLVAIVVCAEAEGPGPVPVTLLVLFFVEVLLFKLLDETTDLVHRPRRSLNDTNAKTAGEGEA
jgi:hypothetical protein